MTIDEAIEKYKCIANTDVMCPRYCMRPCDECVQQCGQVAEWLEELKQLRENANGLSKEDIELNRKAMYNKAIDDFVNECIGYEHLTFEQEHIERIQAIAKQLKVSDKE